MKCSEELISAGHILRDKEQGFKQQGGRPLTTRSREIGTGSLLVSRSAADDQGGYRWAVTFLSYPGDAPMLQLSPSSGLTGTGVALINGGHQVRRSCVPFKRGSKKVYLKTKKFKTIVLKL